jgi:hypothetical protein
MTHDSRPPARLDPRELHVRILDALLSVPGAERMKRGVLLRTAQKIGALILRSRVSSIDPIHFGALDLVYRLNELDDARAREALLAVGRYVVRGRVIPVQRLHVLLDEATKVYLARCPCRASGRVNDKPGTGKNHGDTESTEELLRGILDVWEGPGVRRETEAPLAEVLDAVAKARREGREGGTLHDLFAATWPYWEILLEHPDYDRCWLEGLTKNRKVWKTPKPLAHAWVDALYGGRGVIYTHMEAAGLPYAICSCPGPEADRGCMLTNWHYFSGNDEILLPNETEGFGRRKDGGGNLLPCRKHPERGERACLGCGCDHDHDPEPRASASGPTRSPSTSTKGQS